MTNPSTAGLNLLISDKLDPERDALADVFAMGGGVVHRIGRFWDPPAFDPATVRVYGADSALPRAATEARIRPLLACGRSVAAGAPPYLKRQLAQRTWREARSYYPL